MTPVPYFSQDGVVLYCGDCREILPAIAADVVLTDPPWEMKVEYVAGSMRAVALWQEAAPLLQAARVLLWLPVQADPRPWLQPLALPYLRLVYIRRAIPGYHGRVLMDGEVIHVLGSNPPARKGRMVIPGGFALTYVKADRPDWHPAPRSLIAAKWLLHWWSDVDDVVLDPFAGSGTTLVAAKALGRRAIGIELEERYCARTVERLAQLPLPLDVGVS